MASIFIAENMASTKVGSLLRSGISAVDVENGNIQVLGDLAPNMGNDLYTTGAVTNITDAIYLVDGVELEYTEELTRGIDDYVNVANKPFRLRKPMVGDRFSISEEAITALAANGEVVVGNCVETPAAGTNLAEVAPANVNASSSFVATIVARWTFGTRAIPMVRLEVTKAL